MPSATTRHLAGLQPTLQLAFPPSYRPNDVLIGAWSWQACGEDIAGLIHPNFGIASAYPAASRVLAYPFEIGDGFLVQKVWWLNGTTVGTDSHDCGVYTEDGTTLLVSGGSTLSAGANAVQEVDCTDTLVLPGRYWCAFVSGGTTATPVQGGSSAATTRCMGVAQQAGSGSTLGSTFTPVAAAAATYIVCGIAGRTQVA